jgi:hypothetical protein
MHYANGQQVHKTLLRFGQPAGWGSRSSSFFTPMVGASKVLGSTLPASLWDNLPRRPLHSRIPFDIPEDDASL